MSNGQTKVGGENGICDNMSAEERTSAIKRVLRERLIPSSIGENLGSNPRFVDESLARVEGHYQLILV